MAIPEKPISRIEHYLARANGQNVQPPEPISRIEHYLDGIAGGVPQELLDDVADLKSQINEKAPAIMQTISNQAIASFADGADDMPLKSLVVAINPVQAGTGDPSPENVRPITGWNAVNTHVRGVNWWDGVYENGYIDPDTGKNSGDANNQKRSSYIDVLPNTTYYFRRAETSINNGIHCFYDADKNFISSVAHTRNATFTTPANARYMRFAFINCLVIAQNDISINYPATDTTYHSYEEEDYSTDLEQTVYGGTLDVVSGLLTVNKAMVDLGSFNWISETDIVTGQFKVNSPEIMALGMRYDAVLCSILKGTVPSGYTQFNYGEIGLSNSADLQVLRARAAAFDEATPADVKQFFNGQMLVYELATPQTFQLTPVEVKTILGQNNIFADTGNVSVVYPADTKMYIDNQIAALQALVLENISNS